jgi:hypothetical protein
MKIQKNPLAIFTLEENEQQHNDASTEMEFMNTLLSLVFCQNADHEFHLSIIVIF